MTRLKKIRNDTIALIVGAMVALFTSLIPANPLHVYFLDEDRNLMPDDWTNFYTFAGYRISTNLFDWETNRPELDHFNGSLVITLTNHPDTFFITAMFTTNAPITNQ